MCCFQLHDGLRQVWAGTGEIIPIILLLGVLSLSLIFLSPLVNLAANRMKISGGWTGDETCVIPNLRGLGPCSTVVLEPPRPEGGMFNVQWDKGCGCN